MFSMFHPVLDSREIAPADRSPLASADGRRDGEFRRRATARRRARARARANIVASAKRSTISDGRVAENGEHLLSLRDRPAAVEGESRLQNEGNEGDVVLLFLSPREVA